MSHQIPEPHDEHAEMAIVGSVLRWGAEALADVHAVIGDDGLFRAMPRAMWDAMRAMAEQGPNFNRVSLESELRSRETLRDAGGPQGIQHALGAAVGSRAELLAHAVSVAEHAQRREAFRVSSQLARVMLTQPLHGEALASELQVKLEELSDIARNGAGGKMPWTAAEVGEMSDRERQLELGGGIRSVSTGFALLDRMIKRRGPRGGMVIVKSGRPKMGKTAAECQQTIEALFERTESWPPRWVAKADPTPVFWACDEMRAAEIYDRLEANLAGLDAGALGSPTAEYLDRYGTRIRGAREMLDASPLVFVPDSHSNDLVKIWGYIRRWRSTHPIVGRDQDGNPQRAPAIGVFDFLQSFNDLPGTAKSGLPERVGAKIKFIKDGAKATGLVADVLSQCNRDPEKRDLDQRRPIPSDNEGSGKIEQYADVLLGYYRDVVYDPQAQAYRDQAQRLRDRVVDAAKETGVSVGRALGELDEMLALRGVEDAATRFSHLATRCALGPTEFGELATAHRKLTSAEIIVQRNRHGGTGTVYADFFGQYYRILPQVKRGTGS